MRDPLLHLPAESDFDNLCAINDQMQSVSVDNLAPSLSRITTGQQRVWAGKPADLRFFLGNFEDIE